MAETEANVAAASEGAASTGAGTGKGRGRPKGKGNIGAVGRQLQQQLPQSGGAPSLAALMACQQRINASWANHIKTIETSYQELFFGGA